MARSTATSAIAIKRYLQKSLGQLMKALPNLQACEKSNYQIIASLANLIEQRECTERVDKNDVVLLATFTDMKERLLLKLSCDVDRKVEALRENLQPLKEQRDILGQSKEELWSLLSNHAHGPEYDVLVAGTPTVPSLAMMLEWIDTSERQIRELYCAREYYLNDLAQLCLVNSENCISLWKDNSRLVLDTLAGLQF